MCGLFGVASAMIAQKEREVFVHLGILSSLRGLDSTGIAYGTTRGRKRGLKPTVLKMAEPSGSFFSLGSVNKAVDNANTFLLGHCRAATIGDITNDNAHPFQYNHITGAHNGTCHAYNTNSGSDSSNLFKHLSEEAIEDVVDKASYGAYALTYVDDDEQTLNFIRNKDRPLWLADCPGMRTLVWASEPDMIEFSLRRVGIKYEKPVLLAEDNLRVYDLSDFSLTPAENRVVKPKPKPNTTTFFSRAKETDKGTVTVYNPSEGSWEEELAKHDADLEKGGAQPVGSMDAEIPFLPAKAERPHKTSQEKKETLKHQGLFYTIQENVFVSTTRAEELLNKGCIICRKKSKISEEVGWVTKVDHVCSDCLYTQRFLGFRPVFAERPFVTRGSRVKTVPNVQAKPSTSLLPVIVN